MMQRQYTNEFSHAHVQQQSQEKQRPGNSSSQAAFKSVEKETL